MSTSDITVYEKGDLVAIMSEAFAAQSETPVRDDAGEPLGDIWGAVELAGLFLGLNLQYVNNKSRLQTSGNVSGTDPANEYSPDVDSFVNVFGIYRDPSTESVGTVAFTPASASTNDQYILPGTLVQTQNGFQFTVVADSNQGAYTASGYLNPAGNTAAIPVTVQCLTAGSVGNVAANTITSLVSGLGSTTPLSAYTVTNPQAFSSGTDGETDNALYQRFVAEFISGRFATRLAILTAIAGVQNGLTYQIVEGYLGTVATPGSFSCYVNIIGSNSSTPQAVLNSVSAAIAATKALGISYTVLAPSLEVIPVSATIIPDPAWLQIPGNTTALLKQDVANAYTNYVNNIGLSADNTTTLLSAAKVSAILVLVNGVSNISNYVLNGTTPTDITAPVGTQLIAGTTTFTTP